MRSPLDCQKIVYQRTNAIKTSPPLILVYLKQSQSGGEKDRREARADLGRIVTQRKTSTKNVSKGVDFCMKIMLDGTLENGLNAQYSTPSFLCESGQDCIAFWWYVYLPQLRYSVGSNLRLDSTNFKVVISQHADEIVNAFEH